MIETRDREELVAYLDGELGPEARAKVERRLREDAEYAREHDSLQATDTLLDLYPAPDPSGDLSDRILARVRAGGRLSRLLRLRPALATAASLLVVVTLVAVLARPGRDATPEPQVATVEEAIENLHALEYLALFEEAGEDADAILEDAGLLDDASAILAMAAEETEER